MSVPDKKLRISQVSLTSQILHKLDIPKFREYSYNCRHPYKYCQKRLPEDPEERVLLHRRFTKFLDFVLNAKFLQSFTHRIFYEGEEGYIFTYKHLRVYTVNL
jgi:hypothetical protein